MTYKHIFPGITNSQIKKSNSVTEGHEQQTKNVSDKISQADREIHEMERLIRHSDIEISKLEEQLSETAKWLTMKKSDTDRVEGKNPCEINQGERDTGSVFVTKCVKGGIFFSEIMIFQCV